MKLSVSNIAWSADHDDEIYEFLSENNYNGLEIAPTRVIPDTPYDEMSEAVRFSNELRERYDLEVSSMQSIWFGMTESIFGSETERGLLIEYTKKAIDFANAIGCGNLVFGCPKNRDIPQGMSLSDSLPIAHEFFRMIGDYAVQSGTYIAIEANPPIYNTNFINTTAEAFDLCKELNNPGVKVNIDLGTIIYNKESIKPVYDNITQINHVHISEPYLAPIEKRQLHIELLSELKRLDYDKYISIEMGNRNDIDKVKNTILYVKELCDDL